MLGEISRPRTGIHRLPKLSNCIPKAINYTPTTAKQSNALITPQVGLHKHRTWHHEEPNNDLSPTIHLLLHITILIMVLTWPAIQYPIEVASILGIFTIN